MIGWLQGRVIDKQTPGKIVLDVNGVGYDVETSTHTFFQIENQAGAIGLFIHTIVREDAFLLFGFIDKQERALFRALIKVNGVGPKVAMGILSSATPTELIHCLRAKNIAMLTKLPGIGKKTAERLLIEMEDSILNLLPEAADIAAPSFSRERAEPAEAISALEALGYKSQDAVKVIKKIDDGQKNCEQLLRQALQVLLVS